jgi:hypothetical protein
MDMQEAIDELALVAWTEGVVSVKALAVKALLDDLQGLGMDVNSKNCEIRALKFEACLLAKAWTERTELERDDVTRFEIDTLAAQHYRRGELEPIADRALHPWRMTSELARELSGLLAALETGPEDGDLVVAVRAVVDAAKRGLEPREENITMPRAAALDLLKDAQGLNPEDKRMVADVIRDARPSECPECHQPGTHKIDCSRR